MIVFTLNRGQTYSTHSKGYYKTRYDNDLTKEAYRSELIDLDKTYHIGVFNDGYYYCKVKIRQLGTGSRKLAKTLDSSLALTNL